MRGCKSSRNKLLSSAQYTAVSCSYALNFASPYPIRDGVNMLEHIALVYGVSLFLAMLACLEVGRRYGLKHERDEPEKATAGKKIIEGAFFGLLSLLVAFSFSGAVSRFDHRRELIVNEANDIGTAYLRVDLLAPEVQPQMRDLFRAYLDARVSMFPAL